jgi:hypothetical protein
MQTADLPVLSSRQGLTLASTPERGHIAHRNGMDCRVKPGNDDNVGGLRPGGAGA